MEKIRVLVVDDERLARERIKQLLKDESEYEVVGECDDGLRAIEDVQKLQPDLLFLDIQMPEVDGFGVIEALKSTVLPVIIFTTAYDRYAVRAFDAHAADYLLKPIEEERFHQTLDHARELLGMKKKQREYGALVGLFKEMKKEDRGGQRFLVKKGGRILPIHEREIDWIEAEGEYVRLHVKGTSYLLHEKISALESKLPRSQFVRVHRSAIVNVGQIKDLEPSFHRDYTITLLSGARINVSRSHTENLFKALNAS